MGADPAHIVGIDPGLTRLGYAVIARRGPAIEIRTAGVVSTSDREGRHERLLRIFEAVSGLLEEWSAKDVALERVHLKANALSAVGSIQAAGVVMLAAARAGAQVVEYSPSQVKQAVTGTGTATKEQVQFMVKRLVAGAAVPDLPDAADAVAVAIAHIHSSGIRRLEALTR